MNENNIEENGNNDIQKPAENVLSKRERGELRREEKQNFKNQEMKKRKGKKMMMWSLIVLVVIGAIYGIASMTEKSDSQEVGEKFPIVSREHVREGQEHKGYNSNPPTSGAHYAQAKNWGIYEELSDEEAVHSLEHGGIWISYKNLDQDSIEMLEKIARKFSGRVIMSPRESNDANIALASWGRMVNLDVVDVDLIETYIKENTNKSPERLAK